MLLLDPVGEAVDTRAEQSVVLNASRSYDPAALPGAVYSFAWQSCLLLADGSCDANPTENPFAYVALGTESTMVIFPTLPLQLDGTRWRFTVVYAHAALGRSASASVELEFANKPVYDLSLPLPAARPYGAPVILAARLRYQDRPEAVPTAAGIDVRWSCTTLDLPRLSASGHTDRLSLSLPAAAAAGPGRRAVALDVRYGGYAQRVVAWLPPNAPPRLARPLPLGCAHVLHLHSPAPVLVPGLPVLLEPCYGAVEAPEGLYPLQYRFFYVYNGTETPVPGSAWQTMAAGAPAVQWHVPMFFAPSPRETFAEVHFGMRVRDSTGVEARFRDPALKLPVRLQPRSTAAALAAVADLLSYNVTDAGGGGAAALANVSHAALLLRAVGGNASTSGLAGLALGHLDAQPDRVFADPQERQVCVHMCVCMCVGVRVCMCMCMRACVQLRLVRLRLSRGCLCVWLCPAESCLAT